MYVIKNGELVEDTIIKAFTDGWKIYELCHQDDTKFINMISVSMDLERAVELLSMLKRAKELI